MKALKILLGILGVLLLIFLVLGLLGPKTYEVERSTLIKATPHAVFPHVKSFEKRLAWYPWSELDPNAKTTFEGTDGTVGSVYKWEGNKEVGRGQQTMLEIEPNKMVKTKLEFFEPMQGVADTYVRLKEADKGTNVSWSFAGENNFMARVMSFFMDMDAMIGADFEKGLASLKEIVEKAPSAPTYRGYSINTIDYPATSFIGHRETVKMADIGAFFAKHFGSLHEYVTKNKLEMAGMPSGMYYKWDEENKETDMMAAIPLKAIDSAPKGMEFAQLPAGKAYRINYYGDYSGSANAHYAMDDFFKAKGMEIGGPVLEEYVTDPTTEPDTSKWLTRITYFPKSEQITGNE